MAAGTPAPRKVGAVICIGGESGGRAHAQGHGNQQANSSQMPVHRATLCVVGWRRRPHPQHEPGNCERSMRAMIDRSSLRAERQRCRANLGVLAAGRAKLVVSRLFVSRLSMECDTCLSEMASPFYRGRLAAALICRKGAGLIVAAVHD